MEAGDGPSVARCAAGQGWAPTNETERAVSGNPTEAQVDAALAVLRKDFDLGGNVWSGDFINGPTDPPPGPERDAALRALRAADEEAEQKVRAVVREALQAASRAGREAGT
jgi:hypothetical protein